ncbi:SDR family oxidoreductase (plasmid) [Hymenobacter tibetensis]|uniref:SDR family oxidoreductase n=1 Tax=Hymenobacter tibetensis TaxID=497967 RepID=A0ABY4D4F3_9BACT|nr:SDR family oxidoreductase [Hymenobacter tibetensis]UOG77395.1 SDR family oxidoreductase [Hymenobacter tibetensis]
MKVALVTGANKGIGLETARQLAQHQIHVLLGARDAVSGQAAAAALHAQGLAVTFIQLDISQEADIAAATAHIQQTYGRLDILVNNAAVFLDGEWYGNNVETVPPQVLRDTFDINYFGTVALTQALLPLLKASEAGRIVNVSSISGSLGIHLDTAHWFYQMKPYAYSASKTALNQFTIFLAQALQNTAVKVNATNPGWVQTAIGSDQAPLTPAEGARSSVALALLPADGPSGTFTEAGETLPW